MAQSTPIKASDLRGPTAGPMPNNLKQYYKLRETPARKQKKKEVLRESARKRQAAHRTRKQEEIRDMQLQLQQQQQTIEQLQQRIETLEASELKRNTKPKSQDTHTQTFTDTSPPIQATQFYDRLQQRPALFLKVMGLSIDHANQLFQLCEPQISRLSIRGEERKRKAGHRQSLSNWHQLLTTLYWLRQYPTNASAQATLGIHERTLPRIINRVVIAINNTLSTTIQWPSDAFFQSFKADLDPSDYAELNRIVAVVDGAELPISRPSDDELQYKVYSAKKKQHSMNVLIAATILGQLSYVGDASQVHNDQALWNKSGLRQRFADKPYGVMGDAGFTFNPKSEKNHITASEPFKRTRAKSELTEEEKKFNKALSSRRVVIEHVISHLKNWRVFKQRFRQASLIRHNLIDINAVFHCICYLFSWISKLKSEDELHQGYESDSEADSRPE